ncbi:ABC transporter ATP-binding protein, partial [Turicibacter sanguinis]|nr:ABC transporter ATP-binding protein [Turicibacter sanguinis]
MRKKDKNESSLIKLVHYCRRYLPMMIIALIGAGIGTALTLFGPDKLSEMTDLMTEGLFGEIDIEAISSIGMTLIIIYGISFVLSLSQGLIMANITQKVSKNLRTDLSKKINKLPMSYYNKTTTGDILSRVTNDVDTIGQTLNQSVGTLVTAICLF